ncbi:hypothetical protein SteCoe_5619 [Stentor coeruleus]|uniref:Uncharacterized protein n=1 Tax=Stentor coeruleus TaxID=5963 RepID=A0A1R2CRT4_9CILI|nr:hypothetical protein SteCoe_5619 [Stentor coeruleus]
MIERTMVHIYRDWMKTARIMGIDDRKTNAIRQLLRVTWKKHQFETDPEKIEVFREDQIRGLSNYFVYKVKTELIDKKP